jgi:hypothetical protein
MWDHMKSDLDDLYKIILELKRKVKADLKRDAPEPNLLRTCSGLFLSQQYRGMHLGTFVSKPLVVHTAQVGTFFHKRVAIVSHFCVYTTVYFSAAS